MREHKKMKFMLLILI